MIKINLKPLVQRALREDKAWQDKTSNLVIAPDKKGRAKIIAREKGILCGVELIKAIYRELDKRVKVVVLFKDGSKLKKNKKVVLISGNFQSILKGERVCLNFLSLLSGIATVTNLFVQKAKKNKVIIKDTRKTTPGLRELEKYAVLVGGGKNHRYSLASGIIVKDNHLRAAGAVSQKGVVAHSNLGLIWQNLKQKTKLPIEVEVESFQEFKEIIAYNPDVIMLDNFSINDLGRAVAYRKKYFPKIELEASGGVSLKNIEAIAATGVDSVSVGSITHSRKALDFSLEIDG